MTAITPMPIARGGDEVILYGGTFDPVTTAHVALATRLAGTRRVVLFVPAARSPHKEHAPGAPDDDRARMIEIALDSADRCAVWCDEIDRATDDEPSYWVDTMRRAIAWANPRGIDAGRFLIGADQALAFHRWRDSRWLFEESEPIVMLRTPGDSPDRLIELLRETNAWSDRDLDRWHGLIVETPVIDASATEVRESLARGKESDALDQRVLAYIRERGLYT